MIVKFKFSLEVPLKDSTYWEDIRDLENKLMRALVEICQDCPDLMPQLRVVGDRLEHDQEEIKSRPESRNQK